MAEPEQELSLLNIYEVETDSGPRHLVGFLDSVLAGARGIDSRAMIGEFAPGPDGEFNLETFSVNPEFVAAFTAYMNHEAARSPEVIASAEQLRSDWLYLVDPRNQSHADDEPPGADILGCYAVDADGQIVPGSFQYNQNHLWFNPESGTSGLLSDRRFYDWLHHQALRAEG